LLEFADPAGRQSIPRENDLIEQPERESARDPVAMSWCYIDQLAMELPP
jgi:hypothetical protein